MPSDRAGGATDLWGVPLHIGRHTMNHDGFIELLCSELVPALGCTEPIAIAYAAARARKLLGYFPDTITVLLSGNIIKNVKGVIVPATGDQRGAEVSAILGALVGKPELEMQVLRDVRPQDVECVKTLKASGMCKVKLLETPSCLHIIVEMSRDGHSSLVEIRDMHMRVVCEKKDGQTCFVDDTEQIRLEQSRRQEMSIAEIYAFITEVNVEDIKPILQPQVENNLAIAREGIKGKYGAQVGRIFLEGGRPTARRKAVAYAAAGSDARMSGCALPVVVNSGSGNQGMTVSLPTVVYARELGLPEEKMYRALALSNLIALYQKSFIGELSAYCGVVSAACGSAAAIAYLNGGDLNVVGDAIINTIANISGMVCDGAKPSCAAKIATAVEAAFLANDLARQGKAFHSGEGLVKASVDKTIAAYGRMGRDGMRSTDREILSIMLEE